MDASLTSPQIRQIFLDYFTERAHAFVHSSGVVPHGNPTLLFANAGMNQVGSQGRKEGRFQVSCTKVVAS